MKIYNTLSRKKEEFVPITPGEVKIYACGPTVYNYFHIGNARPFITFDTLRRYFEYRGMKVTFVQNFTDIDDKMINKANELGITVKELGEQYIDEYFKDAKGLGILPATVHPKATENIDAILEMVKKLVDEGYAYVKNGDVYFSTKKFQGYGKLSHQPLEELESGARVDVNEDKEDAMDFAVWKSQKPGEPAWESPWGMGRPGWHIECSAMANRYLGETIDIHGGGKDLVFPHHENEIAQSEACSGKPFARYWMHNGYINVDNQKMSKSLGNFFTVRDVAEKFDYEVIRFFMLSAHYRSPINFSDALLKQAESGLERLYNCLNDLRFRQDAASENGEDQEALGALSKYRDAFCDAMDDDLNTADAIAAIFELVKEINAYTASKEQVSLSYLKGAEAILTELGGVLGLLGKKDEGVDPEIEALAKERDEARKAKNWARADEIRDLLTEKGYRIEDTPNGAKVIKL